MATVIPSTPADILLATRQRLVDKGVLPDERTKISMRMNIPFWGLQAESYAILLPITETADAVSNAGGGRYTTRALGRIDVYVRNRCALDKPYADQEWLTNTQGKGIQPITDQVYDALQEWFPTDDGTPAGNILVAEPFKWVFHGEPRKNYHAPEQGEICCEYCFVYLKKCTLPEL